MKHSLALVALALAPAFAAPSQAFYSALHQVETGKRLGPIIGDNGAALGPLQIHERYWRDAGVPGRYADCADLAYSKRVVSAYLRKYAPAAWHRNDVVVLARIHNGGPRGATKQATSRYAAKVVAALRKEATP